MEKIKILEQKAELVWGAKMKLYELTSDKLPKSYVGYKVLWSYAECKHIELEENSMEFFNGLVWEIRAHNFLAMLNYKPAMEDYCALINGDKTDVEFGDYIVRLEIILTKLHYLIWDLIKLLSEDETYQILYQALEDFDYSEKQLMNLIRD